eukprot:976194-Rhodomonas_salina.4
MERNRASRSVGSGMRQENEGKPMSAGVCILLMKMGSTSTSARVLKNPQYQIQSGAVTRYQQRSSMHTDFQYSSGKSSTNSKCIAIWHFETISVEMTTHLFVQNYPDQAVLSTSDLFTAERAFSPIQFALRLDALLSQPCWQHLSLVRA